MQRREFLVSAAASLSTAASQKAIDAAAEKGGGTVVFPPGVHLLGTLRLRSNVAVRIEAGATLMFSPDNSHFDPLEKLAYDSHADAETTGFRFALLAGENADNITIYGEGTIDGNRPKRGGPKPIALKNCRNVSIRGITIRNAPNYAVSLLGCEYVVVDGIGIHNGYSDGIDPDCSRFVRIANCYVDSHDDAICLKSSLALGERRPTEHVTVSNCVLATSCNYVKFGTESSGAFRNIAVSNCTFHRRPVETRRRLAGIAIESVDGAHIQGVVISNIAMQDVSYPIFIRLGNRGRGLNPPVPGVLEDVSISNVIATGAWSTSSITGFEGHPVCRVSLDDVHITVAGGEEVAGGLDVPEQVDKYPESSMFGTLPAHGLYGRHIDGLTLRNLELRWNKPDARPAIVLDDVARATIDGFRTDTAGAAAPAFWFNAVRDAMVRGCRIDAKTAALLRVTGASNREITLEGNRFNAPNAVEAP
jgi:polygalacturonase